MVKKHLIAIILSTFLTITGWATTSTSPSLIVTTPQPMWSELAVQQKIILAPLSDDWDSMENYRQKKWLSIVERFSAMAPEEQRRVQSQMQKWGKLTPEQRQRARENFKTVNQLPSDKKRALRQKWEEYSNLPEDEKERLKQAAIKVAPTPGLSVASPIRQAPASPGSTLLAPLAGKTAEDTTPPAPTSTPADAAPKP